METSCKYVKLPSLFPEYSIVVEPELLKEDAEDVAAEMKCIIDKANIWEDAGC